MERTTRPSAEDLFLAAIDRPPDSRAAFLGEACGGDTALRREVDVLIACHDAAGGFLESAPLPIARLGDGLDADAAQLPERIGKFAIRRQLGVGGMGCVYLAESDQPRRTVALKVIRPGLSTTELLKRFRHEVQVVALLHHPGIAQLYEAGTEPSPTGPVPYFAMEFVDGPPITAYAKNQGLGIRERLGLLARVARAVHHAHQKGVIHRDLKPGNILVDRSGEPRILDFGVARLVAEGATNMQTSAGQLIGTLAYMSPEQISGDPAVVDARADIYALGIILYEMLGGCAPYAVASSSFADALRTLQGSPARRLGELDRRLRGDPEVIVEKAMARDPALRYQSALDLAADLERYLSDQPILARRPSTLYQVRKFAKRNKALVALASIAMLGVLIGGGMAAWQARRATAEASIAKAVYDHLEGILKSADPNIAKERGQTFTVVEALDRSTIESLRERFADAPRVRAKLHSVIGNSYESLSQLEKAERHFAEGLAVCREHLGPRSRDTLDALNHLGLVYQLLNRLDEAEPLIQEALLSATRTYGRDDSDTIHTRNNLASLMLRRGRWADAERLFRESYESCARRLGEKDRLTQVSLNNLASAMKSNGNIQGGIEMRRKFLELVRATSGNENTGTITALNNLAKDLQDSGEPAAAEPLIREALDLRIKLQGPEHRSTLNTRSNLGSNLAAQGKLDDAEAILREVVTAADRVLPAGTAELAKFHREYGVVLVRLQRFPEAEPHLLQAHGVYAAAMGEKNKLALEVALALADLYTRWEKPDEARAWRERTGK